MRRYGRWLILSTLLVGATLAGVTRPATAAELVDEIKQRGTMRFCVADWPYLAKDPKTGKWTGYDADLAEALAGRLGVKVEFVDSSWGNIIPALLAKKCDVAWGGFFHTAERAQVVDYTKDVHNTGLVVVVKQGETRFKSYDDLNKPNVVFSELADIGEIEARKNFPNATVKILQTDNTNQQALEVAAGRADANVTDVLLAYELIEKKAGIQILPGPIINKSDLGMLVRKDTPELKEAINAFITESEANGALKALAVKHKVPEGFK
jgi:polar amino acid transport system substrate-binding protein